MIRLIMAILTVCILTACSSPVMDAGKAEQKKVNESAASFSITEPTAKADEEPTTSIEQRIEPIQTLLTESTAEPTDKPAPSATVKLTAKPTKQPTSEVTEEPTPVPTVKPTAEPTEAPTPQPTAQPTPETQDEIISVSSSFINAAMAEINRLREANGIAPATFSSSISSSCKSHAIAMAESGDPFHASGIYMFEAVGRASKHMPEATMGGAAANHVAQLKSDEVTQIGIGAICYGNYLYYVVRGD